MWRFDGCLFKDANFPKSWCAALDLAAQLTNETWIFDVDERLWTWEWAEQFLSETS